MRKKILNYKSTWQITAENFLAFVVLVSEESLQCGVSGCELRRENMNLFPVQDLIAPLRLASGYDSDGSGRDVCPSEKLTSPAGKKRLREETEVPHRLHVCSSGCGASHGHFYLMGHGTPSTALCWPRDHCLCADHASD